MPPQVSCSITASNAGILHWMSRHVKRPYRSSLREETAELTRARIRESAARLFVEQGFVATTVKQVAAAAGVAERTVYAAFPSKADLFNEVLGVATVGDDRPVPVAERAEFRAAFADRDGLRPGLEVQQAADILMVLSSPHVHHLLRHDRDWTVDRYRDWLLDTLSGALLPDTREPPRSPSTPSAASEGGGRAVVDGA